MLILLFSVVISLACASDIEIDDVIKRLHHMEAEVENYKNMEKTLAEYIRKTDQLENIVFDLQSQLNEQKRKCSKAWQAVDNEDKEDELKPNFVVSEEQRYDREENPIDTMNSNRRQRKQAIDVGPVAFSAYLGSNLDHAGPGHVIPFTHVSTNEGNGFNGSDGVFICPRAGLYLFIWEIFGDFGHEADAQLKVNGVVRREVHVYSGATGGGVDIVRLSVGDHVWLANIGSNGGYYYAHTMFSGTYISAE